MISWNVRFLRAMRWWGETVMTRTPNRFCIDALRATCWWVINSSTVLRSIILYICTSTWLVVDGFVRKVVHNKYGNPCNAGPFSIPLYLWRVLGIAFYPYAVRCQKLIMIWVLGKVRSIERVTPLRLYGFVYFVKCRWRQSGLLKNRRKKTIKS